MYSYLRGILVVTYHIYFRYWPHRSNHNVNLNYCGWSWKQTQKGINSQFILLNILIKFVLGQIPCVIQIHTYVNHRQHIFLRNCVVSRIIKPTFSPTSPTWIQIQGLGELFPCLCFRKTIKIEHLREYVCTVLFVLADRKKFGIKELKLMSQRRGSLLPINPIIVHAVRRRPERNEEYIMHIASSWSSAVQFMQNRSHYNEMKLFLPRQVCIFPFGQLAMQTSKMMDACDVNRLLM